MADDEEYMGEGMEEEDYIEEEQMEDIELEQAEDDAERIQLVDVRDLHQPIEYIITFLVYGTNRCHREGHHTIYDQV